ncbi:MAG: hypothetical protein ROZ64_06260 [Burkholderiaceae bacterium]|nr:hypothetical protein [Burkholderiaceae bacterium]
MSTRMKIAVACYIAVGLTGLFMFGRYWSAERFMPYHAIAAGTAWEAVPHGLQLVILGVLKVAAAGFLAGGVVALLLIRPVVQGENWARWTSLLTSLALLLPSVYATLSLRLATGAPFPVGAAAVPLVLAVAGFVAARGPARAAWSERGHDASAHLRRS